MDDENLMREILAAIVEDMVTQVQLLATSIAGRDVEECKRLAHYSKGACANVGAESLANLLRDIENQAGRNEFEACDRSLQALSAEVAKLRNLT